MGKIEMDLKNLNFPMMGFASTNTYMVWAITLPVYLGEGWNALTIHVTFIVFDAPPPTMLSWGIIPGIPIE